MCAATAAKSRDSIWLSCKRLLKYSVALSPETLLGFSFSEPVHLLRSSKRRCQFETSPRGCVGGGVCVIARLHVREYDGELTQKAMHVRSVLAT